MMQEYSRRTYISTMAADALARETLGHQAISNDGIDYTK